ADLFLSAPSPPCSSLSFAAGGSPGHPRFVRDPLRRATRREPALERAQCSKELVGERGDRAQESVGLQSPSEQCNEDHGSDDARDGARLASPALDAASKESENGAELANDEEQSREHKRGPG